MKVSHILNIKFIYDRNKQKKKYNSIAHTFTFLYAAISEILSTNEADDGIRIGENQPKRNQNDISSTVTLPFINGKCMKLEMCKKGNRLNDTQHS